MDLAKFISLLSNKALYFASPKKFNDPYDCDLPKSHYQALDDEHENWKKRQLQEFEEKVPNFKNTLQYDQIIQTMNKMPSTEKLNESVKEKFCVSCWHINDYENEALWKIYTNQGEGIAIETTDVKLKESFITTKNIHCDKVRYEDFDTAPIKKGHKHYAGFIKRKAFEYEKEYRAMVMLDEADYGQGSLIQVNLDTLIQKVHISPLMPNYFFDAIKYICEKELINFDSKIVCSSLYTKPTKR
jgi:hypothetical protein